MEQIIAKAAGLKTTTTVTASQPAAQPSLSDRNIGRLQSALQKSAQTVMGSLNRQETIAIVNVTSSSQDMAQFVAGELEVVLVNNQFPVVDRNRLDAIRQEQRLQLSGDVDDNTAISIGKFAGAKVVIIGDISGSGSLRRLRLRALNTETALVIGSASEAF
jgi:curli biogenesis system outer membrane secretion channel CsgG